MTQKNLAENIIHIYQKHGRAWTDLRGTFLYEKVWLDRFLQLLPTSAQVLDLGCGSGRTIAAYLMSQGCQLTGVDSSPVMIEMAQQQFADHIWVLADMRTFETQQKFQGILAWDSFFHLTPSDQRKMFAQFARYAETGTVLMFTSGPESGEAIGDMFGDALYHASLSGHEYRSLLKQYGFDVLQVVLEDPECAGHTVWLAQRKV